MASGLRWLVAALIGSSGVTSCAMTKQRVDASQRVSDAQRAVLEERGWSARVGDGLGIWVSVGEQRVRGIRGGIIEFEYPCSTAARGVGEREGSYQTPRGWHVVADRIGEGLPAGAVLRDRVFTGEVMISRTDDARDHVLSRILRLQGVEAGVNAGRGVDSYDRYIYIHGTSAEDKIGGPASAGCVRMCNLDVIELFERVGSGRLVLITEQ